MSIFLLSINNIEIMLDNIKRNTKIENGYQIIIYHEYAFC